jgi:asparagine synthase (glutamine-hydrolysing)
MCGICGLLDTPGKPVREAMLRLMAQRLAHRGPDASGVRVWGSAGLGHCRLAIIDLSATGHQPMPNQDETLWITYNGELYNYRELRRRLEGEFAFRSRTDTEVVLHAYEKWGEDCLQHFNGIFAFGIYDTVRRQLFAARDPMGVKPFYYCTHAGRFAFASEIKALLTPDFVPAVAKENVAEYLMYGWLADERTLFAGIKSLEPGQRLIVQASAPSDVATACYYAPASRVSAAEYRCWERRHPEEIVEHCSRLLEESVAGQMMSDVPVGALCSGGVDSSLVAAIALKHNRRTRIFHVALGDDARLNEERYARAVAGHLGINIHCFHLDREHFRTALVDTIYHSDFPLYNLNAVPVYYISRVAREKGVKVLLAGEGGDELFGGYLWRYARLYRNVRARRRYGRWIAGLLHRTVDIAHLYPESHFLHNLRSTPADVGNALKFASGFFGRSVRYEHNLGAYAFLARAEERHAQAAMLTDMREYLEHLLNREDKHTMQASVECRVPLLDVRLVEFALNLPYRFKVRQNCGKWVLKKVAERYLPQEVIYRPKIGFNLPIQEYLDFSPAIYRDGFWQTQFGIRPETIAQQCARGEGSFWYAFLMTEIWGRLFLNGDSPEMLSALLRAA